MAAQIQTGGIAYIFIKCVVIKRIIFLFRDMLPGAKLALFRLARDELRTRKMLHYNTTTLHGHYKLATYFVHIADVVVVVLILVLVSFQTFYIKLHCRNYIS